MAKENIRLPSGMGGLVRYFDEYKSNIEFKPGHIILLALIIIIIEIILHTQGKALFGLAQVVCVFPGMNPRMMKQAMKRMGIEQEEIEASEVVIKCPDKMIVISNPQVSKINMMGQDTFQVTGTIHEQECSKEPEISEEDIATVIEQTGASREQAAKALKDSSGDLAEAILKLSEE